MNAPIAPAVLLACAALASGCTPRGGKPVSQIAAEHPEISLYASGTNICLLTFEGRRITNEELEQLARGWSGRRVHLGMDPGTAYRCVGGVIFALQRAGAQPTFTAEPPPRK